MVHRAQYSPALHSSIVQLKVVASECSLLYAMVVFWFASMWINERAKWEVKTCMKDGYILAISIGLLAVRHSKCSVVLPILVCQTQMTSVNCYSKSKYSKSFSEHIPRWPNSMGLFKRISANCGIYTVHISTVA